MRIQFSAGVLSLGLLALAPAAGQASVVSSDGDGGLRIDAAPGERNRVDVRLGGRHIVVSDAAGIVVSAETTDFVCGQLSPTEVTCINESVTVDTGDGDDTIVIADIGGASVTGGAGNDAILTHDNGRVFGGPGDDRIAATAVVEMYGDGRTPGASDGNDTLFGSDASVPVPRANLPDGDVMYGGAGKDVLRGGGARDVVTGGAGNDVVEGGAGNDELDNLTVGEVPPTSATTASTADRATTS